jgi:hypothetical protein
MKKHALLIILMLMGPLAVRAGSPNQIVGNGKSDYSIVIRQDASAVESFAASELQKYIELISGARLPIETTASSPAIIIGRDPASSGDLNIDWNDLGYDGFVIHSGNPDIILAGRKEASTLYAVYALLEKFGCRWYAPNFEFYNRWGGEYVPESLNLTLNGSSIEIPDYKYRKKYVEEGVSHTPETMKKMIDWMAKNRMNVFVHPTNYEGENKTVWDNVREEIIPELNKRDMLIEVGGHGYPNYLPPDVYFDKHPEWFGLYEGERTKEHRVVFNTANKSALEELTVNVVKFLDDHPEIDIFDFWPPDGARWSNDPNSLAQGNPEDRQAIVLNYVSKEVRKQFPDLIIEFIAYADYIYPPRQHEISGGNILMDYCPIRRSYDHPLWDMRSEPNELYYYALMEWLKQESFTGEISYYSYYRKYAWRSLPMVIPRLIKMEMEYYRDLGLVGMGSYSEPADWFTYELNHYIIAQASWNVDFDISAVLDEYCRLRFGDAAGEMKGYFQLIEKTVPKGNRIRYTDVPEPDDMEVYLSNLDECKELLGKAKELTKDDDRIQDLLGKLSLSLEYTLLDMQIRKAGLQVAKDHIPGKIEELNQLYQRLTGLFFGNLDKGIFMNREDRYYRE